MPLFLMDESASLRHIGSDPCPPIGFGDPVAFRPTAAA